MPPSNAAGPPPGYPETSGRAASVADQRLGAVLAGVPADGPDRHTRGAPPVARFPTIRLVICLGSAVVPLKLPWWEQPYRGRPTAKPLQWHDSRTPKPAEWVAGNTCETATT